MSSTARLLLRVDNLKFTNGHYNIGEGITLSSWSEKIESDFFKNNYGSRLLEEVNACNCIIEVTEQNSERDNTKQKAACLLTTLRLLSYPATIKYTYALHGNTLNSPVENTVQPIYYCSSYIISNFGCSIDENKIETVKKCNDILWELYLERQKGNYRELFHSIRYWDKALTEKTLEFSCMLLVAALEGLFSNKRFDFTSNFKKFIECEDNVIEEMRDIRHSAAHCFEFDNSYYGNEVPLLYLRQMQLGISVKHILLQFLFNSELLEISKTAKGLRDFKKDKISSNIEIINLEEKTKIIFLEQYKYLLNKDMTSLEMANKIYKIKQGK